MFVASINGVVCGKLYRAVDLGVGIMERVPHSWFKLQPAELESKWPMKRHVEKLRRRLWLRRACYCLMLLTAAAIVALMVCQSIQVAPSNRSVLSLPASMIPYYFQHEAREESSAGDMYIEDVVKFVSEVMLLVRIPPNSGFPNKERVNCRYGDVAHFAHRKALTVHLNNDRVAILCGAPPDDLAWDVDSVVIEVDKKQEVRRGKANPRYRQPLPWNLTKVVYEVFPTDNDVVVFAHGINHTRGRELPEPERLRRLQCVYGGYLETAVTVQDQEVFRCSHPPVPMIHVLAGKKMTLRIEGRTIPSVAFYNPPNRKMMNGHTASYSTGRKLLVPPMDLPRLSSGSKTYQICSCTMIYNGAKFLKEWVYYHSHLGVEKFYLYDNNSEDDLDDVVASLKSFNVTKKAWPWVKTQEAGFSHCSLIAEPECKWMLFTDIDEYVFPSERYLSKENKSIPSKDGAASVLSLSRARTTSADKNQPGYRRSSPSILATFTQDAVAAEECEQEKVGQISIFCLNFGASGLTVSPSHGVTQGYTCRVKKPERHKSLVLLGSIDDSLSNVIHHFALKPSYESIHVRTSVAVINHYKFQVWDEFKTKFDRRAATYVADWTEDRNHLSRDRVPDLGITAIEPTDWESRYCEQRDYGLRDYTRRVFGAHGSQSLVLAWE